MSQVPPTRVEGFYEILPMKAFRKTATVTFSTFDFPELLKSGLGVTGTVSTPASVQGIDRVRHAPNATSPGPVDGSPAENNFYYHPHQRDVLLVARGERMTTLYSPGHKLTKFIVFPDKITKEDGTMVYDGPAALSWPARVYHQVNSGPDGSLSFNLAIRSDEFDIDHEFDIWADVQGSPHVVREGHVDQGDDLGSP